METTEFFEVLSRTVGSCSARIVDLHAVMREHDRCLVRGSNERWERALGDVIRNASIVSPEDKPIEIRAEFDAETIVLDFVDHGCGIEPEELESVTQGPALAEVREALKECGGAMHVSSAGRGSGCTVRLTIPVFAASATRAA